MRALAIRAGAVILAATWPTAWAQGGQPLLDLRSGPQAPAAGSGVAAIALADQLLEQAAALEAGGGARERAKGSVRRLAAALVKTGEAAGEAGSARVVLGRTLARGMSEIDGVIAAARGATAEAELELAAHDLITGATALDDAKADAGRVVRDAVAGLAQMQAGAPAGSTQAIREWSKLQGLSAEAAAALEKAEGVLAEAEGWAAYRDSATRLRGFLQEAGVAAAATPPWIPAPARQTLGERARAAATALVDPATRSAGAVGLERAARIARLIGAADRLDDTPAGKKTRATVAGFAGLEPREGDLARLDACDRILRLATARTRLPEEKVIARQVRIAWRTLLVQARQTEGRLLAAVETALARADAMSDPGVLAAVAAHQQVLDDLRLVERLNAAMTEGSPADKEPQAGEKWRRVADRVLKLGQDMAKPPDRDVALAGLRDMAGQIVRFAAMPGEDELREAGKGQGTMSAVWVRLTGGKGAALLSELSDRRSSWIQGWDKQGFAGAAGDAARLVAIRGLLEVLRDAAGADVSGDGYARLNATTAWELSGEAMGAVAEGLADQCAAASGAMADGDAERCAAAVAEIREKGAVALLAGRMSGGMQGPVSRPVLVEVCGDDGVEERVRAAVADVCRYGAEVAAARKSGTQAEAMAGFVSAQARTAMESLGSEPSP